MSEKIRVLIADKMDPRAAAIFRERGIEVDEKPGLSSDEFKAIIGSTPKAVWPKRTGGSAPRAEITPASVSMKVFSSTSGPTPGKRQLKEKVSPSSSPSSRIGPTTRNMARASSWV